MTAVLAAARFEGLAVARRRTLWAIVVPLSGLTLLVALTTQHHAVHRDAANRIGDVAQLLDVVAVLVAGLACADCFTAAWPSRSCPPPRRWWPARW